MINKILSVLNSIIRIKSNWFNNNLFQDCRKFWYLHTYNLDVVNLGSTTANAGFVYPKDTLKGFNMAMSPQTFVGDYEILRNYSCFLKEGATVIIPLCPFSSLGGYDEDLPDKYYSILNIVSFPHASFLRQQRVSDMRLNPIKYFPLIQLFPRWKKRNSILREEQFEKDAQKYMNSWKKQFSIYNWDNPLSIVNQDAFHDSAVQLGKIIDYCLNHSFKPVLVLPPVTKELSNYFTPEMEDKFIYSFVKKANIKNIPFLNYFKDKRFAETSLFQDSFTLNNVGAERFTFQVLTDLKIIP